MEQPSRSGRSALPLIGGSLAVAGAVASAAIAAFESVPLTLGSAFPDDTALNTAVKAFDNSGVLTVVFIVYLTGTALN